MKKLILALVLCMLPIISSAQTVTVVYSQRAPFIMKTETGIEGSVGKISVDVLKDAGFTVELKELPLARQINAVEENNGLVCGLNYFERAERKAIGNFSKYILLDQPIGVLLRASDAAVLKHTTFKSLTTDKTLSFGRKVDTSYGVYLDGLIKDNQTTVTESTEENPARVRQLILGRFNYMFIQSTEAEYIVQTNNLDKNELKHILMTDSPKPNTRHLFCSFKFTPEYMDRLNASIEKLVK